jgi:hypothetical protein
MEGADMTTIDETVSLAGLVSRDGEALNQRLRELITAQRRVLARTDSEQAGASDPDVLPLDGAGRISARTKELCAAATHRLRVVGNGQPLTVAGARAGVRCQVIRPGAPSGSPGHSDDRFRDHVPLEMVHVDDSIALITTDIHARRALLIRSGPVVTMLADWFDLWWTGTETAATITSQQRRVLALMPTADDRVIARRLDVSVTTVRRQIKVIYDALGVNNRFAAGVAAAKRGWI